MAMPAARAIRYKSAMHANPTRFGLSATIAIADSGKHTGHPPLPDSVSKKLIKIIKNRNQLLFFAFSRIRPNGLKLQYYDKVRANQTVYYRTIGCHY
jgi:hypothetical protein